MLLELNWVGPITVLCWPKLIKKQAVHSRALTCWKKQWASPRKREFFWKPELYRLRSRILYDLPGEHQAEAEACLQEALAFARQQGAKSLELRAALDLCRVTQGQQSWVTALEELKEICGWFHEGFATADLQEARNILGHLAR
jgi:predicted ATPase